jgi:hypothetical protein
VNGLRRIVPLLAVAALLAGVAIAASLSTPQITTVPALGRRGGSQPPPSGGAAAVTAGQDLSGQAQRYFTLPSWATTLVSALCIAIVLAVVGAVLWLALRGLVGDGRRRMIEQPAPQTRTAAGRREEVLAAVDAGLVDLDDNDTDPRRAVIACWVRLEEAAAAAGTARQPGDAPGDLVLRLLAAHQVSAGVLLPLADVYRLARYATHTVDSGMRDSARAALRQLRAELAAEPAMGSAK